MSDITNELLDTVKQAYQHRTALKVVGGNSKSFLGRQTQGEIVDLSKHSGILQYQPVELVLTARAGTPIQEIQQVLAEQGQMLSFEPPLFVDDKQQSTATLGGTLAANLSGPARPWAGSIRDLVLGVDLINGKGELLSFGGQVMKNVAGYDVSRSQAGALGTLGIMTKISLKVMPMTEMTMSISLNIGQEAAIILMNKLAGTPKPISGACWYDQVLYIRLSGAKSSVEASAQQWINDYGFSELSNAQSFWQQLNEYANPLMNDGKPLWRFSVKSTAAPLAIGDQSVIDWGGAQRWVSGDYTLEQMEEIAHQAGGTVSLWRGGDRTGEVNHRLPKAMQQLQQRLKEAFDPHNILNAGRLYTGL